MKKMSESKISAAKDIFYKTTPFYEQNVKLTFQQRQKIIIIIKTLEKTANTMIYGVTQPRPNR